jgi:hypothetical protein
MTHPYARADYAAALGHIGRPVAVPEWDAWVLARPTPCGTREDAVGVYPVTVISDEADLAAGLARLKAAGLVSVVLVAEDRLGPPSAALEPAFDMARPFKSHQILDRDLGPLVYGKHHRYEIKRALGRVVASEIALGDHLPAWEALYGELAARHGLGGAHVFPPEHHALLAALPGVRTFAAFIDDRMVSAHVFVTHKGHAMSHLAASAAEGYAAGAAYAVNDLAAQALTDCRVINFGGGAGMNDNPEDGLVRFKRGFANTVAPARLCGAVLDADAYRALSIDTVDSGFFPAYRGPRKVEQANEHQG